MFNEVIIALLVYFASGFAGVALYFFVNGLWIKRSIKKAAEQLIIEMREAMKATITTRHCKWCKKLRRVDNKGYCPYCADKLRTFNIFTY